jgi:diguanylate cyclase (GGDEF)-like protein
MLWGLLRFAVGRRSRSDRVRLALDLAVVAIGGSAAVLYVVLGPTAVAGSPSLVQGVLSIAYPVGDMVLLVGLASVLVREADSSARCALQFIGVGLLLYVAGDVIYGYISLHSTYHGGSDVDTFWVVAIALWAVGAAAQETPPASAELPIRGVDQRTSWPPYVATALGFGVLLAALRHSPFFPQMSLAITAVVLAILVSVRQLLSQRDVLRSHEELQYQALHDPLTGLPNRVLVFDRAQQMLAGARRHRLPAAALYLDVDDLKQINDSLGHAAGDELLVAICARLSAAVRGIDTVGRLGGDEFVVLVDQSTGQASAELVAERLLDVIRNPFKLTEADAGPILLTASIGIAYGRQASVEQLLRDADLALHEAKAAGKDRVAVFDSELQQAAKDLLDLRGDLQSALAAEEFFLRYQPIVDLKTETMMGVEALIRWSRPGRGTVSPRQLHPRRRRQRLDRGDRPLGTADRVQASRPVAATGPRAWSVCERVRPPARSGRPDRRRQHRTENESSRPRPAHAGDHRDGSDARSDRCRTTASLAQGARRAHRDRRLRHGL